MSSHIDKDDIKRWFYTQDSNSGEVSLIVFGYGGDVETMTLHQHLQIMEAEAMTEQ
tara:strand:+ start:14 stop:181 length:168 start_codon:yes stop_codon:yes gene_type:complete